MKRVFALLIWLLALPLLAAAQSPPVTVFAAASLRGALDDLAARYGAPVTVSFAGSGTLARQVAAGAPADLVVLANPVWMDWLAEQDVTFAGPTTAIARNRLVMISHQEIEPLNDISALPVKLDTERLAMGHRDAVPAGAYARQWLQSIDLWNTLEPQLAETDNVRSALALVARGAAPFGIVYATDAMAETRVHTVFDVPASLHDPILYPAAALSAGGQAFLEYLASPAAQVVFAAHGFAEAPK
ncbi:molybdate ABC transporter substrate-binding protein [Sulfitobacter mediterraneus]|uniref:Molybdate transport system substrate-binding protein n=1 Tax=Sulfitobacter mediterraneus TaxID=83219 RepID=A0A2T6CAR2_9RHOB|nr:molybdate ABC transporter substrate-binding protein [Sulfitobacter mediterraneus]KIN79371.1 Molybdate ABC transporter, periplasmic molybdate-binding protein [Sulfitobacter mediterraneus KCTC 32188]PTX72275.1 molybdate transport system substrate-binding protein [Sulfitobacter mediterraneus]